MRAVVNLTSCVANSIRLWRRHVIRPPASRLLLNARTFLASPRLRVSATVSQVSETGDIDDSPQPPPKRKRGRPRKDEIVVQPKRPVGRPRENRGRPKMLAIQKRGRPSKPKCGRPRVRPAKSKTPGKPGRPRIHPLKERTYIERGEEKVGDQIELESGDPAVKKTRRRRRTKAEMERARLGLEEPSPGEEETQLSAPSIQPSGISTGLYVRNERSTTNVRGRPLGSRNRPKNQLLLGIESNVVFRGRPPRYGPHLPKDPIERAAMMKKKPRVKRERDRRMIGPRMRPKGRPLAKAGILTLLSRASAQNITPSFEDIKHNIDADAAGDSYAGVGRKIVHPVTQQWTGRVKFSRGKGNWQIIKAKSVEKQSPILYRLLDTEIASPKSLSKSTIVGEADCKAIFEKFPLADYEGCQIIDFNPGFGLYSRALNAAVKPSKHFLVEPELQFHDFLRSTCTDKSFRLVAGDFYNWKMLDGLIEQGLSPDTVPWSAGVNKSLIITGMLHKGIKGDRFMAQIIDAMAQREWIFKYGRVKILPWLDGPMIARYIPRSFGRRNRAAILLETYADVREYAYPPQTYSYTDVRFFHRIDRFNERGGVKTKYKLDVVHGVDHAHLLTYVNMPRDPMPVTFDRKSYWPPQPWAETTLLDITPKIPLPYLDGQEEDSEPWKFYNLMISSMLMGRNNTVAEGLMKIGSGVEKLLETDEVLKEMPALADKKTMFVSVDDLAKLARAYEFWPWRVDDPFLGAEMRLRRSGMLEDEEIKKLG